MAPVDNAINNNSRMQMDDMVPVNTSGTGCHIMYSIPYFKVPVPGKVEVPLKNCFEPRFHYVRSISMTNH